VNACRDPDLFWGIKGGGGGSLGVVTRVTLRTREIPGYFGGVFGTIRAKSDAAFRKLTTQLIRFYQEKLFNPHWGEQIAFTPQNLVRLGMVFQGLNRQEAEEAWRPFLDWIASFPGDFSLESAPTILAVPARDFWNPQVLRQHVPTAVGFDDRPGAPEQNFFWRGDAGQASQVMHGYKSAWLPASLLRQDQQSRLTDAIFAASRFWSVSLHFNKGLAGAPAEEISAAADTAMNPAVLDAIALAIIATGEQPDFPGVPSHELEVTTARRHAKAISQAMGELLKAAPDAGAYVSESDFFQSSWQHAFWGAHYTRLLSVKKKYDPAGLFFVHHGVGSEEWSADGFARIT
jgi:hypothetical protein